MFLRMHLLQQESQIQYQSANEETFTSALNMNVMVTKLFAMEKTFIKSVHNISMVG